MNTLNIYKVWLNFLYRLIFDLLFSGYIFTPGEGAAKYFDFLFSGNSREQKSFFSLKLTFTTQL